jgi:hypothetical protein
MKYAHEIARHPGEGEAFPLDDLARYHYAQAHAWYLAMDGGSDFSLALTKYLGHSHLALLHDALAQGLSGQVAADWASVRHHSESAELVWERAVIYGLDPTEIRPYTTQTKDTQ